MQVTQATVALLELLLVALPAIAASDKSCTLACQPGQTCVLQTVTCVLQTVTCVRAPCPPIQTCVASSESSSSGSECAMKCGEFQECRIYDADGSEYCADVCAEGRCPEGTTCELQEVQCIRAPCPPVAECTNTSSTHCS
ncbi:hypothetical protein PRIC1_014455 [Phytophthora ramorum]